MRVAALAIAALLATIGTGCTFDAGGFGSDTSDGSGSSDSGSTGEPTSASTIGTTADEAGSHSGSGTGVDTTSDDTGPDDPCAVDNGGCDPDATCDVVGHDITCTCPEGQEGDGWSCMAPGMLPSPLRVEIECGPFGTYSFCYTMADGRHETVMGGEPGLLYNVTVQVRGVVEMKSYNGGNPDGPWNSGGAPADDATSIATLQVLDPPQEIRLNNGSSGGVNLEVIDVTHDVVIAAGSQVVLTLDTRDGVMINNNDDLVAEGVPPAPEAFGGQHLQIDVLAIAAL